MSFTNLLRASGTNRMELVRATLRQRDANSVCVVSPDALGYVAVRSKGWVSPVEPLRGLPIAELVITMRDEESLKFLAGVPLRTLRIRGMSRISNLEPFRGMALRELDLSGCRVANCSALEGMPLRKLTLGVGSTIDLRGT